MLKKRIAAVVVVRHGVVVQSSRFRTYLPIGRPGVALEYLSRWGIDEVALVDIGAGARRSGPDMEMVRQAAAKCFVPLTVGGGISSVEQIAQLLRVGADKVALNQALLSQPALVSEAAAIFGSQCVIASIDVVRNDTDLSVYDYVTQRPTAHGAEEFAVRMQDLGAGELLVTSVDRDGTYEGYDLDLVERMCAVARVPVIACGGARGGADMAQLLQRTKVSAAAASNFFHFTEHSAVVAKSVAAAAGSIRIETHADYRESAINADMRLLKKPDAVLEELLYAKDQKEII